jgi:CBS domain containing-hemolysin-like protein
LPPLIGAFVSALVGALFACADTAVTTLSTARLGALAEQATGPLKGTLERLRRDHVKVRATYVLGRVAATAVTSVLFGKVFAASFTTAAPYLSLAATVILMGALFELSTSLGRKHADRMAPTVSRLLRPLEIAMLPLAVPLGWISVRIHNNDSVPVSDHRVSETEVELMVDQVERSGLVGKEPAEMIRNVLEFADRTARDVMVPRSKVEAIEVMTPLEQVLKIVTESGHSRYPVYKDQIDNVVGLLYAKDLFKVLEEHRLKNTSLKEIMRSPANFVAESQPLSSLLREMRARREHMAVVVDEFGAASGIVTLEDVLEEIVGDIRDEHDETEEAPPPSSPIEDIGDGRVVVDASVTMSDLRAHMGAELDSDGGGEESIGGMLTHHAGKIPAAGTAISKYGLQFIVRDSDDKHIGKVEIVRQTTQENTASDSV